MTLQIGQRLREKWKTMVEYKAVKLKCPECGKDFAYLGRTALRYMASGIIRCPHCRAHNRFAFDNHRLDVLPRILGRCIALAFILQVIIIVGAVVSRQFLLSATPSSFEAILLIMYAALWVKLFAQVLMLVGYLGQWYLIKRQHGLVCLSAPIISGHCPVCNHEPSADAVDFVDYKVCTGCKAEYVQQLKEGVLHG